MGSENKQSLFPCFLPLTYAIFCGSYLVPLYLRNIKASFHLIAFCPCKVSLSHSNLCSLLLSTIVAILLCLQQCLTRSTEYFIRFFGIPLCPSSSFTKPFLLSAYMCRNCYFQSVFTQGEDSTLCTHAEEMLCMLSLMLCGHSMSSWI